MRGLVQIVFGVIVGLIGVAWAGPAAGLLAESAASWPLGLGQGAPAGLMIAGGLYVVTGLVTMALSAISKLMAKDAERKDLERQLDLFHELLTGAIVRMVGADGVIAASEMTMVTAVLEKFGQTPVPEKTIRSIAEAAAKDPEKYVTMMASKQDAISDEHKTHILRACLLVAMADVALDVSELDYLAKVAAALRVPPERLETIRDELANVTQKLVGAAAFAA